MQAQKRRRGPPEAPVHWTTPRLLKVLVSFLDQRMSKLVRRPEGRRTKRRKEARSRLCP